MKQIQQKHLHLDDGHFWAQCRRLDKMQRLPGDFFRSAVVVRVWLLQPRVVGVPCCCSGSICGVTLVQLIGVCVRLALGINFWRPCLDGGVADLL